jgi:hypothetical protein
MYDIILHSKSGEVPMENYTKTDKGGPGEAIDALGETIDALTEENQRYLLGILEALAFAQAEQGKAGVKGKG